METSSQDSKTSSSEPAKIASCLPCRKSKLKCNREAGNPICKRCAANPSLNCITPEFRLGRRKGSKNKSKLQQQEHNEDGSVSPGPRNNNNHVNNNENNTSPQNTSYHYHQQKRIKLDPSPNNSFPSPNNSTTSSSSVHQSQQNTQPNLQQQQPFPAAPFPVSKFTPTASSPNVPLLPWEAHFHKLSPGPPSSVPPQQQQQQQQAQQQAASASYANRPFSPSSFFPSFSPITAPSPLQQQQLPPQQRQTQRVQGAENPLGLLASVSESVVRSPSSPANQQSNSSPSSVQLSDQQSQTGQQLQSFFGASPFALDAADDTDPLCIGLVTEQEARLLFDTFHAKLSHTRWGLDPKLHTLDFVRRRSSLLCTSILAGTSKFVEGYAAISTRLHLHLQHLIRRILTGHFKSVEIILGLLVAIPWMSPSQHMNQDPTTQYLAAAMNMGLDLGLDKVVRNTPESSVTESKRSIPHFNWISPRKALFFDGFPDIDPASSFGCRLIRNRQRAWMALWVLDRGVALSRGRIPMVPVTISLESCIDEWPQNPEADFQDPALAGALALRLGLDNLIERVRSFSDPNQLGKTTYPTASNIRDIIDGYFNDWHNKWDASIKIGGNLHPYLDILVQHTRLSVYGAVVNHVETTSEVSRYFCSSGLSSALNVMRALVQGRRNLKSCPNNLAVMVSFAVCFTLALVAQPSKLAAWLEPGVRTLIRQALDSLEHIGSTPSHRQGVSAVYARHLKDYLINFPGFEEDQQQQSRDIAGPPSPNKNYDVNANDNNNNNNNSDLDKTRMRRSISPLSPVLVPTTIPATTPGSNDQSLNNNKDDSNKTRNNTKNITSSSPYSTMGERYSRLQSHVPSAISQAQNANDFDTSSTTSGGGGATSSTAAGLDINSNNATMASNNNESLAETILLSSMTDTQIVDTVNQLDPTFDLGFFTNTGMDWIDWLGWRNNPSYDSSANFNLNTNNTTNNNTLNNSNSNNNNNNNNNNVINHNLNTSNIISSNNDTTPNLQNLSNNIYK